MKCLECGHDLIEMRRDLLERAIDMEFYKAPWELWISSHTHYAGHCKNCMCDWEWDEYFKDGKFITTQPARIFWG